MADILQPDTIHSLLVAEAERRHLPECYKNDLLVHDLNWLHDYGSQEFIWILRSCGTFIFPLDQYHNQHYSARYNWPDNLVQGTSTMGDKPMLWYHFADGKLTEVGYERALEIAQASVTKHLQMAALSQRIAALEAEKQAL